MTHLEQTPIAESVTALFRESPFAQPGEYHELQVAAGQSIAEIIASIAQPWQHDYLRVVLNGEVINQDEWSLTVPNAKDTLNIILVPKGGDVGQIFKAIAVIAIVIVATYFAGPAGLGLSAPLAAGVGAAAGLAASLTLNAIFPPPAPASIQSGSSGVSEDPVYGFSKVGNATNPYGCIPRVYGRRKLMPQHAMNPIIICSGVNQYLYQAFTAGYGPLQIEDIRIGDTPIGNYSEVEVHVHESFSAGDPLHLVNQDVWQDPHSIKLTQNTVNVIETTDDAQALGLDLQFNQGLFWINGDNGDFGAEAVAIQIQIRPKGYDLWSDIGQFTNTVDGGSLSGSTITVSRKSQRPFFVTVNVTLPSAGKYEVKAVRLTENREGREKHKSYDTVYIASLRSIRYVAPIAPDKPISLIEVKIRATEQLNGAINNLSCIATSKLPVYNGATWSVQATRNPAWCYLDAIRGNAVRRPIKDHRILFGDLLEWALWCDSPMANAPGMARVMCDLEITSATSVYETMRLIAATGFATPAMVGNRYSVAIDRLRSTPVQIFTPRNSKLVNGSIGYHIQPHALRMQFTPTDETTADEVVVFDDGYSADGSNGTQVATRYEVMKVVGISRREQAYVIGRRSLAQGRLRIEQWTISTDVESLLATRGSYVCFSHDVPMIGSGHGRVIGKSGQTITLDEPISATGTIYARIRHSDNTQQDYGVTSYTGSAITLSGDPSAINDGDLVVYGNLNSVTEDCYVKSVTPGAGLTAELVLVPYAAGVYTAEVAPIPAYQPVISWSGGTANGGTAGLGGKSATPKEVNSLQAGVIISYVDNAPRLSVNLSWTPPVNSAAVYGYMVYHYTGGRWVLRATVYETSAVAYSDYQFVDEAGQPVNMNGVGMVFAVSAIGADGSSLPPELAAHTSVTPQILGPASVASVSVVGGVFENKVAWQLATNGFDVAYAEIWSSTINDRAQAALIATVKSPASTYNHVGLGPGTTWYYWVRLKDAAGNVSVWYPGNAFGGIGCTPSANAEFLLDQLQGAVGLEQVAEEIARPISLVDPIKFKLDWELGNANIQKLAEKTFGDTERVHSTAQVITEAAARADGDEASAILIQEVSARLDTGDYAVVKEQSEATANLVEGVNAKYLLQVDANGHVAAVQLGSNSTESSMVWLADKFLIAKPDGTGVKQLLTIGEVNGVNVLGFDGYLLGAGGTFTGNLQAANGTFIGELQAATGTFGGRLMAGVLDLGELTGTTEYRSTPGTYYFTLGVEQTRVRYQIMAGGGGGGSGKGGEWNTSAGGGGGGGAGEYKTGTLELSPGTQIRVIVGSGGAGATTWASAGAGGTASSVAFWNGSTWITLVTANPGGGGAGAPLIYQDNLDGRIVNGSGGGGYPAGESAPGGSVESVSARGGKGANSVWGVGGTPGYPNVGWGSAATGHGAGGGGGAGYHAWRNSGADGNKGLFGGGASGTGGRSVIEFYNPNTVVLRNEFIALDQRVTAIEQRLTTAGIP